MSTFIECKIKYDKMLDNGTEKKVTDAYLVDALSFTEAEERLIEEVSPYISGEHSIVSMKETNIAEIFTNEDLTDYKWYRVKAIFVSLDEKKGIERRTPSYMMVQATDVKNAIETFEQNMKGTVSDVEISAISETSILEVYKAKLTAPES